MGNDFRLRKHMPRHFLQDAMVHMTADGTMQAWLDGWIGARFKRKCVNRSYTDIEVVVVVVVVVAVVVVAVVVVAAELIVVLVVGI